MSKLFETFESLLSNSAIFSNTREKASKVLSLGVDCNTFAQKLKSAESKKVEEEIVNSYLSSFKKRLSEGEVPNADVEDIIKLCMTCEVLGYKTPFVYVHCLKLAQKGNLQEKHTGYAGAAFFLHPNHELAILLINTIQKDLRSSNYAEIHLALSSICNIINMETVQNVFHLVQEKLNHEKSSVRKSAILTLYHCLVLVNSSSAYQMVMPKLEKALADRELEVVSASVCTITKIIQKIPGDFAYLIKSLVELQEQILLRRIPRSMVYCDIPAPWLQLDLLRLVKLLCRQPEQSEQVVSVLKKTIQQPGVQNNLTYAIMFEAIETITFINPSSELIEIVLNSVSTFLKSKNSNLKLAGIEALILVVQRLRPSIGAPQQEIIMECLKLPDDTVQLKTLELLYNLANASNVQAICKRMVEFLSSCSSKTKQMNLAQKILQLANRFIYKKEWFISVITYLLDEAQDFLPATDVHNAIDCISKDPALLELAKRCCIEKCKGDNPISSALIKLFTAVVSDTSECEIWYPRLLAEADSEALEWIVVSVMEMVMKTKNISPNLVASLKESENRFGDQNQIFQQLLNLIDCISELKDFDHHESMDPSLTFLDNFVLESLKTTKLCYKPPSYRNTILPTSKDTCDMKTDLMVQSNVFSDAGESGNSPSIKSPSYVSFGSQFSTPSSSLDNIEGAHKNVMKVKSVWTKEGRVSTNKSVENSTNISEEEKNEDMKELFAGIL